MKKRIIFFIVFCALVLIIIMYNLFTYDKKTEDIDFNKIEYYEIENINEYYLIKNCVNNFYYNYYLASSEELIESKCVVLDLLDINIVNKYQINIENLINILGRTDQMNIQIDNIKYTSHDNLYFYYVIGTLQNENTKYIDDFKIIVILDYNNKSYSIVLQKYMEDFNYEEINTFVGINENNKFEIPSISTEKYIMDIFNEIRTNILYNKEKAYDTLSNTMNEFKDYNDFIQFIESNRNDIYFLTFDDYKIEFDDNNTIYNCIDKNNKLSIKIIIKGPFKYEYYINII